VANQAAPEWEPSASEMAKAWPDETIGIIKFSIGGSSVLAWKPDWSKKDADRVGQGRHGSLYKKLMEKVDQASKARDIGQMLSNPAKSGPKTFPKTVDFGNVCPHGSRQPLRPDPPTPI